MADFYIYIFRILTSNPTTWQKQNFCFFKLRKNCLQALCDARALPRRSLWITNHEWVCHLCRYRAAKAARNVTFCWKSWQKTFKIHFVILGTENPLPSLFRTSSKKKHFSFPLQSIHPFYTGHVITKKTQSFGLLLM